MNGEQDQQASPLGSPVGAPDKLAAQPSAPLSAKSTRERRWTPHFASKPYCTCRRPWAGRPMVQCAGRCQEWFHTDCIELPPDFVAGTAASSSTPYYCTQCLAKGSEWLREPTYCHCNQPWGGRFMLECDDCAKWFHGSCVGVSKRDSLILERWRCAPCVASAAAAAASARLPPAVRARNSDAAELPVLSEDLWAHIVSFVPVGDRCRKVAEVSRRLLAAVDATLEGWARRHRISLPAQSSRPSRFGPSKTVTTLCPWLHAVQTQGCRCCLEAVGEFVCKRDPTIHSATLAATAPLPKRFVLCRKCARREPLLARLQLLGFDVATESLSGKPLFPRHFHCALGAAVAGVPDVA